MHIHSAPQHYFGYRSVGRVGGRRVSGLHTATDRRMSPFSSTAVRRGRRVVLVSRPLPSSLVRMASVVALSSEW